MKSAILKLKQSLARIDDTSSKIFTLGLLVLEICLCTSAIIALFTLSASDGSYYELTSLIETISATGFRVFTLGTLHCFVSDIAFHINT